jgi:hypothetical protein
MTKKTMPPTTPKPDGQTPLGPATGDSHRPAAPATANDISGGVGAAKSTFSLRLKPDRRRTVVIMPPHLERRGGDA